MGRSEEINELATALAKAQGQLTHAVKDSQNQHLKSKYADLASVWEACRKPLSDNGLSVVQLPDGMEDNCLILETTLLHSSGQWIGSRIKIPMVKQDAQGFGSALTYARRYALAAIVGVYQDDDDAESAKGSGTQQKSAQTNRQPEQNRQPEHQAPAAIVDEQKVKNLIAKATKDGLSVDDLSGVAKWKFGVELTQLKVPDFAYLMNNLPKAWQEYVAVQSAS